MLFNKNSMSTKYKATTTEESYFITLTTVGWIDVFTRLNQKYNIINALNYCQQNKGLEIYAYVIKACEHLKREQNYKVWQDGYHAKLVETNWFIKQKVDYIHNNPVKDKTVSLPEDYYFSSARNYAGLDNDLEVIMLDLF